MMQAKNTWRELAEIGKAREAAAAGKRTDGEREVSTLNAALAREIARREQRLARD
jgi:hypothetical protein